MDEFHFAVREGQAASDLSIQEAVGQAIGAGSMCWDPPPGDQVFDSTRASAIVDRLVLHVLRAKTGKSVSDRVAAYTAQYEIMLHMMRKQIVQKNEEIQTLRDRVAHYEGANSDGY